jgi:hypothetical protein
MPLVTYDEFMVLPFNERLRTFNQITPENRAHLVQAHLERWLAKERTRLTSEQLRVLKEALSLISPAWYRRPQSSKTRLTVKRLEEELARVLPPEDMRQAVTAHADYIPPA